MAENYVVRQGDSLTSVAFGRGFHWQTLWNHERNAELKERRQDPNVLYPGDVLYIPDKKPRSETRTVDARHTFVRKAVPDRLRIRLLKDFQPRANEPYVLVVDGNSISGTTDADGMLEQPLHPGARTARLILDDGREPHELAIGHIDPVDTVEGLQGRLSDLGLYGGEVSGQLDESTRRAMTTFQAAAHLPQTGEPDAATCDKLKTHFGC